MSLALVFSLSACKTVTDATWESEKEKQAVIKKAEEILDNADPAMVREINEILDKMDTSGWHLYPWLSTGFEDFEGELLAKKEVQFLIAKFDIAVPLMLKRLAGKKRITYLNAEGTDLSRESMPACVYFLVFGEKNVLTQSHS